MAMNDERRVRCSFCGKHQDQVKRMIAGPGVYICNECVSLCMEAMGAEALLMDEDDGQLLGLWQDRPDPLPGLGQQAPFNDDIVFPARQGHGEGFHCWFLL